MTYKQLIFKFKKTFEKEHPPLDFRRDVYAPNQYGLSPCVRYDRAKDIVLSIYSFGHQYIDDNKDQFPTFGRWEFNIEMEVDKLRTSKIKSLIDNVIGDLMLHAEPTLSKVK